MPGTGEHVREIGHGAFGAQLIDRKPVEGIRLGENGTARRERLVVNDRRRLDVVLPEEATIGWHTRGRTLKGCVESFKNHRLSWSIG